MDKLVRLLLSNTKQIIIIALTNVCFNVINTCIMLSLCILREIKCIKINVLLTMLSFRSANKDASSKVVRDIYDVRFKRYVFLLKFRIF